MLNLAGSVGGLFALRRAVVGNLLRVPIYTVQSDRAATRLFRNLQERLLRAILLLALCVAVFTVGFFIIDLVQNGSGPVGGRFFDALWNTLNLVSTVGNLKDVSTLERAWAMLTIVVGLGAVLYGFGSLQALFQVDVAGLIERRNMKRKLKELSNHIAVCGYGRVGRAAAAGLQKHGASVLVIDQDAEAVARADEDGFMAVQGDCTEAQTLREASIDKAGGLIATLDTDAANVYLILLARELCPGLRIISRAERSETRKLLRRAGADRAVAPGDIAALQLTHLMLKPIVSEFIAAATGEGEYDFAQMQVVEQPHLQGRTLGELDLPERAEAIVISVVSDSGRQEFNPRPDRKLDAGDTLLLVCREGGLERIAAMK